MARYAASFLCGLAGASPSRKIPWPFWFRLGRVGGLHRNYLPWSRRLIQGVVELTVTRYAVPRSRLLSWRSLSVLALPDSQFLFF